MNIRTLVFYTLVYLRYAQRFKFDDKSYILCRHKIFDLAIPSKDLIYPLEYNLVDRKKSGTSINLFLTTHLTI